MKINSHMAEIGYSPASMTRADHDAYRGQLARARIRHMLNLDAPETVQEPAQAKTVEPLPNPRQIKQSDPWDYLVMATGVQNSR